MVAMLVKNVIQVTIVLLMTQQAVITVQRLEVEPVHKGREHAHP